MMEKKQSGKIGSYSKKRKPKVLIASIFYSGKGYCLKPFFKNLVRTNYDNVNYFMVDNSPDSDGFFDLVKREVERDNLPFVLEHIPWVETTRMRQVASYNRVFERFLQGDEDYLWIVESDLFPHRYVLDLLLEDDKEIVSAVYLLGLSKAHKVPCWTTDLFRVGKGPKGDVNFGSVFEPWTSVDGTVKRVGGGTGFGCQLIHRSVIERVKKVRHGSLHADTYFHEDLDCLGISKWIDTRVVVEHQPSSYPSDDW